MILRFDNALIVGNLLRHLKGKTKESLNFFIYEKDIVLLQSTSDFILETKILDVDLDGAVNTQFSVMLDISINLLHQNEGTLTIYYDNTDFITIEQENITITLPTSADERINSDDEYLDNYGIIKASELSIPVKNSKALINISKSLECGISSVNILNNVSYILYTNTVLIERLSIDLPDLSIPYNTYNNLVKNIIESKVEVLNKSNKTLCMKQIKSNTSSITTYSEPNIQYIQAINKKIKSLDFEDSFNCSSLSKLSNLFKCFPKSNLTLFFYKDFTIGILFDLSTSSSKTIKVGIKQEDISFRLVISVAQFDVICRIYGNASTVDILKGKDLVCFHKNNQTLILSGMTY